MGNRELTEDAVLRIMEGYGNNPQQLIAVLLDIQAASGRNYVDRRWAELASRVLAVPLSTIFDVLTFYAMFSTKPRGEYIIEICESAPCGFCKARQVIGWFETAAGIKMGQTSADGKISLARTSCVGACETGPVAKIGDEVFGGLNEEKVNELVNHYRFGPSATSTSSVTEAASAPAPEPVEGVEWLEGSREASSCQN